MADRPYRLMAVWGSVRMRVADRNLPDDPSARSWCAWTNVGYFIWMALQAFVECRIEMQKLQMRISQFVRASSSV
jgi:hypothetical protein